MSLDEDVEMLSARMGNLQCQENDKKDVSSETIDKIKEPGWVPGSLYVTHGFRVKNSL